MAKNKFKKRLEDKYNTIQNMVVLTEEDRNLYNRLLEEYNNDLKLLEDSLIDCPHSKSRKYKSGVKKAIND